MIRILICNITILFMFWTSPLLAKIETSCECPKISCDACSEQVGLSFYTEKCAEGKKVRSCSRPTCSSLDPQPKGCHQAKKDTDPSRTLASDKPSSATEKAFVRGPEVGIIKHLKGQSWLKMGPAEKVRLKEGQKIHEKDTLLTGKKGRVLVSFHDGNRIHLSSSTELNIRTLDQNKLSGKSSKKRTVLDLIKGQVRSEIKQKYNGTEDSHYRVRTKSAVAGVRGTDFVVNFSASHKEETMVKTIKGEVNLHSPGHEQQVSVSAGKFASYVVAANNGSVFSDYEINEFMERGYMTPVYKMTKNELRDLNLKTSFPDKDKQLRLAARELICKSPSARLNQCQWECKNNPKGASRCRTDLPQVNCVRRRCNANGQWAEESRLPASFHESCHPQKNHVGECDY